MYYQHALLLLLSLAGGASAILEKTIHEEVFEGKPLGPGVPGVHMESNTTTFVGHCSPSGSFSFPLYGPHGKGAIGVHRDASEGIEAQLNDPKRNSGEIELRVVEPNFFGVEDYVNDDYVGIPFKYHLDVEPHWEEGSEVVVTCTAETRMIVIVKDAYNFVLDAVVKEDYDSEEITLEGDREAVAPLKGSSLLKAGPAGHRGLSERSSISFEPASASTKTIKLLHDLSDGDDGLALIDGVFMLPGGQMVRRTLVRPSLKKSMDFQRPRRTPVKCCDINNDGDIEIAFPSLPLLKKTLRVDLRVGLEVSTESQKQHIDVVDVTTMLAEDGIVTVHGGWIRKALEDHGFSNIEDDAFEVTLMDFVVTDPNDAYRIVGVKGNPVRNSIPAIQKRRRRNLKQKASQEEKGVTMEMRVGRKPITFDQKKGLRQQKANHKKILVHGHCAAENPFPLNHFTHKVAFKAADNQGENNWSNDEFARKIDQFANDKGITGCSCIAHDQGGAACLHLYTYYWSCLDEAENGGDKLIQTVGTSFQGSVLEGGLGALGSMFGAECGYNYDLSITGAEAWLRGIPSWAREKVTYYTSTYESFWWRWDYCHLVTDMILGGESDGATTKDRSQLPGAINGGHVDKQCHSDGMRDAGQTRDFTRNSLMDADANY